MSEGMTPRRLSALRFALVAVGLMFTLGHFLFASLIWPGGWIWGSSPSHYGLMIVGLYDTLGLFLFWAARDPERHGSLIWFTAISSAVHAAIMAAQAMTDPAEHLHLFGDVLEMALVAAVLGALAPRRSMSEASERRV